MDTKKNGVCDRVIELTLLLLCPFIAVAISPVNYSPLLIKTFLLQCGAVIIFSAFVIKIIKQRGLFINRSLLRNMLPECAFVCSALFNFIIITPSKDTSLDELLIRVSYFVVFFVTAVIFTDYFKVQKALVCLMITGFIVSFYGILQHFDVDPFHFGYDKARISSFFGNPNFYVGFLTLVIPAIASAFDFSKTAIRRKSFIILIVSVMAAIAGYVSQSVTAIMPLHILFLLVCLAIVVASCVMFSLRKNIASAVTLFLLVTNILMTGSRSGLIGLGAAIVIFSGLTFVLIVKTTSWRNIIMLFLTALICAIAVVASVIHITHSNEGRHNTVSQRKYYVQGALELIHRKPFLGNGIGTFKNNYPLVKPRESWAYNEVCFEHVSNVYNEHLEILHDEGLLGFLIYAWILLTIIIISIKAIRENTSKTPVTDQLLEKNNPSWISSMFCPDNPTGLLIGLLSGVMALIVGNSFSLSMRYTSTGFIYWFFIGLVTAQASSMIISGKANTEKLEIIPVYVKKMLSFKGKYFLAKPIEILIVAFTIAALFFFCRILYADICLKNAVEHSKNAYQPIGNTEKVFHDIFIEGTNYQSIPEEWEKAIGWYGKSLRNNPHNLQARYFLGNAFNRRWNLVPVCNVEYGDVPGIQRNDVQRSLEQYDYIYRQVPHFVEIDFELGELYVKLGDLNKAIFYYNEYKKYMPYFTKIHKALADTYMAKKDWLNAIESFKDAIDLNSQFVLAHLQLSIAYLKAGKADLAQESMEKAREISPKKADLIMAGLWAGMGEYDTAINCCKKILLIDSSNATVHAQLGWYYIQKQLWELAIFEYEKAALIDQSNPAVYVNLSNLYFQAGKLEAAKGALQKAIKINPQYVQSLMNNNKSP